MLEQVGVQRLDDGRMVAKAGLDHSNTVRGQVLLDERMIRQAMLQRVREGNRAGGLR